jgi:hypothetical protein
MPLLANCAELAKYLLITYKDVLKGIELSLNNHVGKVKKTCLILEKENDIITHK